jgi:hypothetical protein
MFGGWYFSRPFWLYRTIAGRGARDGRINHPKDGIVQEMDLEVGRLDFVGAFLREIEVKLADRESGSTVSKVDSGDYDMAVQNLETVMRTRRAPLDSLPAKSRRELVKVMVDLINQHQKSKRDDPNFLTHYEADLITMAEIKIEAVWKNWESLHNSIEAKATHVHDEWFNAYREYEALNELHSKKEYRQPHPLIGTGFYALILIGLGLSEYWINMLAFQLWFVKDSLELYISAALPSITIPFFAHIVGTQLRYWQGKKELGEKIRWQSVVIVMGSLIVALCAASSLVWLRTKFVAFEERQPVDLSQAVSVLALNVAGLCAGIGAAYIAHDVDSELENICKRKKILLKYLHGTWRRWAQLAAQFDVLRGKCIAEVGTIRADAASKIMEYRDYNIRYRADVSIPSVFRSEVGDRFFKARDFSHELSATPPPFSEVETNFLRAQSDARRREASSKSVDQSNDSVRSAVESVPSHVVDVGRPAGEAA